MDILTQGILGATVAQSGAKKEHIKLASLIGLCAGLLADADIFIRSATDPLLTLEYHRHFTHSLFFIPAGAFIASILLWLFLRNRLSYRDLYFYCLLGYLFSGFIDTCTSYGTYFLWPLSDTRISWHIIAVIDPVFTLILITGLCFGFYKKAISYSRFCLLLAACYLLIAIFQLDRAQASIAMLAKERQHTIEKWLVKPTIGNIIMWRSIYLYNDTFYIDVARVGWHKKIYEGTSINRFSIENNMPLLPKDSVLYKDISRFVTFSDGFVGFYPGKENIIGDIRYSISPLSNIPIWGIKINTTDTTQHVVYELYRDASKKDQQQFLDILLNREPINSIP